MRRQQRRRRGNGHTHPAACRRVSSCALQKLKIDEMQALPLVFARRQPQLHKPLQVQQEYTNRVVPVPCEGESEKVALPKLTYMSSVATVVRGDD